jgi:hypothetical protein
MQRAKFITPKADPVENIFIGGGKMQVLLSQYNENIPKSSSASSAGLSSTMGYEFLLYEF